MTPLALSGRAAVVTGAASGIGRALALRAAREGMALALADIDADALETLAGEIRAFGADVFDAVVDVRDSVAVEAFAARTFERSDSVALVFANAGVMRAGTTWQSTAADRDLVIDVNLKGAVNTACAFIPLMVERGEPARVVFTGSTSGFLPRPHLGIYSATKHALWGIAEAIELELAEIGSPIGVSLLAPAGVKTAIARTGGGEALATIGGLIDAFGMPVGELADIVFAALAGNRFWILPHPDFKQALVDRAARVASEQPPATR